MSSIASRQNRLGTNINLDAEINTGREGGQPLAAIPTAPRTAPGQLMGLQGELRRAKETIEDLRTKLVSGLSNGEAQEILISEIYTVPGRRRILSPTEREQLKGNLAKNPLVQPIVVGPKDERGYELFSGHNRVELFTELGRDRIPAVVRQIDRERVNAAAFYANLLAPELPDYLKFLGLKARKEEAGFNYTELAAESGISLAMVSLLFNYEELPQGALAILNENPTILGATSAGKLADAAQRGAADRVVEAVKMLADSSQDNKVTEVKAVQFATTDPAKPEQTKRYEPIPIKVGKTNFCKIIPRANQVTISFKDQETSEKWIHRFEEFVLSELKKEKSEDSK